MVRYTAGSLDAEWRRLCLEDETLARMDPPTESGSLVHSVLQRVRPGSDYPENLLAHAASGFGAAGWRLSIRVLVLQAGYLVEAASGDADARVDLVLRTARVVASRVAEAASDAYRMQAETDPLTELGNRRRYESLVGERATAVQAKLTVAAIDLDDLKSVNDSRGHQAGDEYLRGFGECLRAFGVKNNCHVFRFGGDESGVLSSDLSEDDLRLRLEDFRSQEASAAFSFGTASSEDPDMFSGLMAQADVALYEEKEERRRP